ncbi:MULTISPECIES: globin domain-containing protein [Arthrobacter]|uniref:nitric oxide dioxygenase n=1 Tax=Arthrobacter psychrochitiniphilus TaxID=291045 RepID=A0A2V3DTH4_9MICC|nr:MULTISPECIES: globin domain-containing protein [Arthrobacter]NYG15855.1 nitric oxide dioxygenase [Arthrobacter psychrochitiniphilus]PXA66707.1 hemin transporter [Arthrobacter psychrochitiniphilus]
MLSEKSRPLIEATLPLVGSRLGAITPNFYSRMFAARPELLDGLFSRANQNNGEQQKALAGSIAGFASALVANPDIIPETMLSRIAHKHTTLGITEDQYEIVYKYLFEAIAEELSDVITAEIAEAWTEVYWLMANALIKIEKGLYSQQANDKMWMPWRVIEKNAAGTDSMTFVLEPADDTPVTVARPGQFVSVKLALPDGLLQCRQYSLSADVDSTSRRVFTTKRDDGGEVSPVLHNNVQVGDIVELSNPAGDLTLDGEGPIIMATAGIGCTPSASALRALAANGADREIMVLHAEKNLAAWALRDQMTNDVDAIDSANLQLWLEEPTEGFNKGFMSLEGLDIPENASMYVCGPLPFMKAIRNQAIDAGIPSTKIHYEVFGPDLWLAGTAA